jgi:hypothetical protein
MNNKDERTERSERTATRVLVALDCAYPSSEALQELVGLLGTEQVELTGLYIEDEDLFRAASFPGLREISLTGQMLELNADRLRGDIDRDLARIRRAFEELADRLRLRHRFAVARGRLADALSEAASESDFVVVSRTVRVSGLRTRPAPCFDPLLKQAKGVLFVNEPWASGSSVIVLGAEPAALAAAAHIAEAEHIRLVVALPQHVPQPASLPQGAHLVRITDRGVTAVAELCLRREARLLVLPADAGLETGALLALLLDRVSCSVLKLA